MFDMFPYYTHLRVLLNSKYGNVSVIFCNVKQNKNEIANDVSRGVRAELQTESWAVKVDNYETKVEVIDILLPKK